MRPGVVAEDMSLFTVNNVNYTESEQDLAISVEKYLTEESLPSSAQQRQPVQVLTANWQQHSACLSVGHSASNHITPLNAQLIATIAVGGVHLLLSCPAVNHH